MTTADDAPPRPADEARRRKLLDAAIGVFLRFGFRKASMDEVARAADVSRQGLYLHFATKEELFRAAVQHVLETSLETAAGNLADPALSIEKRLVGAFDAWVGRFVGTMGTGAADLGEASDTLVGPLVAQHEARFTEAVVKAMRTAGLVAAYKPAGLTARQLTDTLSATARGLKYACTSRPEFVERLSHAVRALCMPLRSAGETD
ncbi:MAG: TetR/AcrR family transcriptional regulator [Polyangia bacterium]